jgi:hypothetical protein
MDIAALIVGNRAFRRWQSPARWLMLAAFRVRSHEIAWIICPNWLLENQDDDCGESASTIPENSGLRDMPGCLIIRAPSSDALWCIAKK